jgi:hypothetical protein
MTDLIIKSKCGYCSKSFTRKSYYDRHVLVCELLIKSTKERNLDTEEKQDTPTVRKLYEIIMEMSLKYQKMEKKVEELSKYIDNKKRKLNIVDWLNSNYKNAGERFDIWYKTIKVERKHLETIFTRDYVNGIFHVLKDYLDIYIKNDDKEIPIRAYDEKDNILYIRIRGHPVNPEAGTTEAEREAGTSVRGHPVNPEAASKAVQGTSEAVTSEAVTSEATREAASEAGTSEAVTSEADTIHWQEMKKETFNKMVYFIHRQMHHEFVVWQNENTHRINDDAYVLSYALNIKKFIGGNSTTEQLYGKIHRELYKYLKREYTQ